jgi:predicted RNase H-like nuclease
VRFIGIDLGWLGKPSGLAILELSQKRLQLTHLSRPSTHADLLAALPADPLPTWIGLDAPVIITNPTGTRPADRAAHSLFARQHAGAYPVNLGLPFASGILALVASLRAQGYSTAIPAAAQSPTRHLFEVYPHAASIRLFDLPRILPYKKGPLASRLAALTTYRDLLSTSLKSRTPSFSHRTLPTPGSSLATLKACEDQLDAILCAYIAAHFWYWHLSRTNILGNADEGFIANPSF